MKKLITICLIMAVTFATQAQKKELNKEETVAYIEKLVLSSFVGNSPEFYPKSIELNGKVIQIIFHSDYSRDGIKKYSSTISNSTIFEIYTFQPKYDSTNYNIRIIGEEKGFLLQGILTYEDASRLKRALEHLQKLLENDNSDPFGN